MNELIENAKEFLHSGEDNLDKKRYNAASADFFKAIVIICDYIIYTEIKRLPKNHADRFSLLEKYFPNIHSKVSSLFKIYIDSYNLKVPEKDALKTREYANDLKNRFLDKKQA